MPTRSLALTRSRRDAYDAVRRVCNAPMDSIRLRDEIAARVQHALPADCVALLTSDPELGLLTHGMY